MELMYIWCNLKQKVAVGVNQIVCFTCFSIIIFFRYLHNVKYKYNHIMRTKWPINKKQTALEREFHKLSLYAKKLIMATAQFHTFAITPDKSNK